QSGIAFAQQPVIQLLDASGNAVSESGVEITVMVSDGGIHVGSASATTNTSGTAAFADLGISGLVGDYTIEFSATDLTLVASGTITLGAGTVSINMTTITATPTGITTDGSSTV